MFPSFSLFIFTEEDGNTINNERQKIILNKKNAEVYSIFYPLKSSRKNQCF